MVRIDPGEMVGYIGVNGVGKSTTIKMLTGIMVPTSGEIRVLGRDSHRQRVPNAYDIGGVFGQRTQLWWHLALLESLTLIAKMYEIEPTRYNHLLHEFSETLELAELPHMPIRTMSLGQKMRAELAATLIHEPKVVYLDEPTIGLDLIVKERIRAFIKDQNRKHGTTVVLTTHDLGDIEELCQRVHCGGPSSYRARQCAPHANSAPKSVQCTLHMQQYSSRQVAPWPVPYRVY